MNTEITYKPIPIDRWQHPHDMVAIKLMKVKLEDQLFHRFSTMKVIQGVLQTIQMRAA